MIRRWGRRIRRLLKLGVVFGALFGIFKALTKRQAPDTRSNYEVHGMSTGPRPTSVPAPDVVAAPRTGVPDAVAVPDEIVVTEVSVTAVSAEPPADVVGEPDTMMTPVVEAPRKPGPVKADEKVNRSGADGVDVKDPGSAP